MTQVDPAVSAASVVLAADLEHEPVHFAPFAGLAVADLAVNDYCSVAVLSDGSSWAWGLQFPARRVQKLDELRAAARGHWARAGAGPVVAGDTVADPASLSVYYAAGTRGVLPSLTGPRFGACCFAQNVV
jgi:hypothetical protein